MNKKFGNQFNLIKYEKTTPLCVKNDLFFHIYREIDFVNELENILIIIFFLNKIIVINNFSRTQQNIGSPKQKTNFFVLIKSLMKKSFRIGTYVIVFVIMIFVLSNQKAQKAIAVPPVRPVGTSQTIVRPVGTSQTITELETEGSSSRESDFLGGEYYTDALDTTLSENGNSEENGVNKTMENMESLLQDPSKDLPVDPKNMITQEEAINRFFSWFSEIFSKSILWAYEKADQGEVSFFLPHDIYFIDSEGKNYKKTLAVTFEQYIELNSYLKRNQENKLSLDDPIRVPFSKIFIEPDKVLKIDGHPNLLSQSTVSGYSIQLNDDRIYKLLNNFELLEKDDILCRVIKIMSMEQRQEVTQRISITVLNKQEDYTNTPQNSENQLARNRIQLFVDPILGFVWKNKAKVASSILILGLSLTYVQNLRQKKQKSAENEQTIPPLKRQNKNTEQP